MTVDYFLDLAHDSLFTALRLGLPVLVVAFVVGVAMGALQTLFQIQDSMISGIPKLLAVMVTVGVALPWMIEILSELFQEMLTTMPFGS